MGHIFISYSHTDADYAQKLSQALQGEGMEVWIDERLDYGSQWPFEIQKQLDSCSAFILIMSPRSFASDWVQSELQRAKRKRKPIFPLLLEGDEPWLSVESTQYYDVRGADLPDQKFFSALKHTTVSPGVAFAPPREPGGNHGPSPKVGGMKPVYAVAIVGVVAVMLAVAVPLILKNISSPPATTATDIPPAGTPDISDIEVMKVNPEIVSATTPDELTLSNCGGNSVLQQKLSTQATVKSTVTLLGTTSLTGGNASPLLPAQQAELKAQISAKYSNELDKLSTDLDDGILRADPKTQVVYIIQWKDRKFISTVSYKLGAEKYLTDYEYVLSVPIIISSEEKVCGTPVPPATDPPTEVTQPPTEEPTTPPNPVAEELAFVSDWGQSQGDFRAFVIDPNNPDPVRYQPFSANPPGYQRVFWPSFCGSRLAVEAQDQNKNGNPQWIFFLERGLDPTKWTQGEWITLGQPLALGQPHCSPDGRYLSYSAKDQGSKSWNMLIVANIASNSSLYSLSQTNIVGRASWPRSMNSMLFPVLSNSDNSIWTFHLMKNFGSASYDNQSLNFNGASPSISPDGSQVAYYCPGEKNNPAGPLCIADFNSGISWELVKTDKSHNVDFNSKYGVWISAVTPVWSSDGQWIYYMDYDYDGGDYDIFRIPSTGGKSENITRAWPSNEIMPATR
jgi:hypothetical protein